MKQSNRINLTLQMDRINFSSIGLFISPYYKIFDFLARLVDSFEIPGIDPVCPITVTPPIQSC